MELVGAGARHVGIMVGLAGFAVTGIVLIVGLAQRRSSDTTPLATVIVMILVAYFFYVGNGFLFSYFLPNRETGKNVPPRVHFAPGSTMEFRPTTSRSSQTNSAGVAALLLSSDGRGLDVLVVAEEVVGIPLRLG